MGSGVGGEGLTAGEASHAYVQNEKARAHAERLPFREVWDREASHAPEQRERSQSLKERPSFSAAFSPRR